MTKTLTTAEMIEKLEANMSQFAQLTYGLTVTDLTQGFNVKRGNASAALQAMEKAGQLTSRYDSRIKARIYWVK